MNDTQPMALTADELAGIVGLFGGLTRDELTEACIEVAFKQSGERPSEETIDASVDAALDTYHLVHHPAGDPAYLIPGPTAFPDVPEFAEDLHHVLDIEPRELSAQQPARQLLQTWETELANGTDDDRAATIQQLSYDLEAWADVDAEQLRAGIDRAEQAGEQ